MYFSTNQKRITQFFSNFEKKSENFEKHFGILRETFWEVLKNITEIFENYFENFQKKFGQLSRIIAQILENYFIKF